MEIILKIKEFLILAVIILIAIDIRTIKKIQKALYEKAFK